MNIFSGSEKEEIKSVGLVFEPNFFTVYYYADTAAKKPVGYDRKSRTETTDLAELKGYTPLFAVSFKPEWTLVPKSLFEEDNAGSILAFNTEFEGEDVEWDEILGVDAIQIFGKDAYADNLVGKVFPGLRVTHGARALIEFHRKSAELKSHTVIFQAENEWYITVFRDGKLLFANSINADYPEDVRYFLLYTFKQLQLKTDQKVVLLGEAVINLGLKNILEKYLRVEQPGKNKTLDSQLPTETRARHWAGIYASQCAL
ncbi:MAG: DUF3822 family protein [Cryomorphaceae bacterium]|nr:DUF3822 family protein [Flavobacteriales bacterium]